MTIMAPCGRPDHKRALAPAAVLFILLVGSLGAGVASGASSAPPSGYGRVYWPTPDIRSYSGLAQMTRAILYNNTTVPTIGPDSVKYVAVEKPTNLTARVTILYDDGTNQTLPDQALSRLGNHSSFIAPDQMPKMIVEGRSSKDLLEFMAPPGRFQVPGATIQDKAHFVANAFGLNESWTADETSARNLTEVVNLYDGWTTNGTPAATCVMRSSDSCKPPYYGGYAFHLDCRECRLLAFQLDDQSFGGYGAYLVFYRGDLIWGRFPLVYVPGNRTDLVDPHTVASERVVRRAVADQGHRVTLGVLNATEPALYTGWGLPDSSWIQPPHPTFGWRFHGGNASDVQPGWAWIVVVEQDGVTGRIIEAHTAHLPKPVAGEAPSRPTSGPLHIVPMPSAVLVATTLAVLAWAVGREKGRR